MLYISLMGRIKQLEKLVSKYIEDLHTPIHTHTHTHTEVYALGFISKIGFDSWDML